MKLISANKEKVVLEMTLKEYNLLGRMVLTVAEEYDVVEQVNIQAPQEEVDRMFDIFDEMDDEILKTLGNE